MHHAETIGGESRQDPVTVAADNLPGQPRSALCSEPCDTKYCQSRQIVCHIPLDAELLMGPSSMLCFGEFAWKETRSFTELVWT